MTGYGREEFENESFKFVVELKTVNHKYCNIYTRLPNKLNSIEDKIKKYIKKNLKRGRIEININFFEKDDSFLEIKPNFAVLDEYHEALLSIKERYQIQEDINLELLAKFKDAVDIAYKEIDEDDIWENLKIPLDRAIESVLEMRRQEGLKLKNDLLKSISTIKDILRNLEEISDDIVQVHKEKMYDKINELLDDVSVDEERLEQEIAIYADKTDINEEIVRIKSHLDQFINIFDQERPLGKKLDFLAQELNREVNTIGSKSPDVDISNDVVDLKTEIGKIREQILNIE
jgi:uncharacterized protein (TIGR00255 family)